MGHPSPLCPVHDTDEVLIGCPCNNWTGVPETTDLPDVGRMRAFQRVLYAECRQANWDPNQRNTLAEEVSHLHEEVSEVFRAWRKYHDTDVHIDADGRPHGVPIELADVLIGLFYNAERHGIDLMAAVVAKHRYNLGRDYVAEGRQLHGEP